MGVMVVAGAKCVCPCGTVPCDLQVSSQTSCMCEGKPIATVQDMNKVNLATFGMCSSLLNPAVASATAAALGVLTPQPCNMMPAGPWSSSNPKLAVDGKPALANDATLKCAFGTGPVTIVNPGQTKVMV